MRSKSSRIGAAQLRVDYTDRAVTGWGGLWLPFRFFEQIGLREVLAQALPDGRTSPNQVPVVDQALAFFATVLTGGTRFAHAERLRSDEVIRAMTGVERWASAATLTRYFNGFVRSQVEVLSERLARFVLGRIESPPEGEVLDLDSTVFERYGHQEGSLKGHNPRKHGRPSHHPILAMLAGCRRIAHVWLRSGNTGTARGVRPFLAETLARLGDGLRIRAVRADSGFFVRDFLEELEARQLGYAVAARNSRILRSFVMNLEGWKPFGDGLDVGEVMFELPSWKRVRRLIVVRERLDERPDARGRRLFELPDYSFHFVVTNLDLAPEEVWRFYNGRADSENRIKEFKNDYGAAAFCLGSFDGTEAVLRLNATLFNLISELRDLVAQGRLQLSTLRSSLFVAGALLGADGRTRVLRLGLRGRLREQFEAAKRRILRLPSPTALQLTQTEPNEELQHQRPWRQRPPSRANQHRQQLPRA